ncbi:UDP-glucose 4-epimerase [Clostridia bacterium]|nr:UDP-glucose 4-epimerase [Clostridia bacterium]
MSILLTGGAGYIGSHTAVALLNAGENIVILDNFSNSSVDVPRRITEITGQTFSVYAVDVLHKQALDDLFSKEKIEAVIHFAGLKAVGESVRIPLTYYNTNITGTLNLLEVMKKHNCKNIVFSSSATVYGINNPVPYTEDLPLSATNAYGRTKLMIEAILGDLYTSDNEWRVSLLRYFNPIGAHKSGLIGEVPGGIPNNLLPYVAQVAVGKLPKLGVFGDDYETPDGTGVRDYLHVVDLAEGHLAALAYIRENAGLEAVNLGTGNGSSVLEVVDAFERASGKKVPYAVGPRRAGDIAQYWADASKAERLFGWKAKLGLDDMCRDGWKFAEKYYE